MMRFGAENSKRITNDIWTGSLYTFKLSGDNLPYMWYTFFKRLFTGANFLISLCDSRGKNRATTPSDTTALKRREAGTTLRTLQLSRAERQTDRQTDL